MSLTISNVIETKDDNIYYNISINNNQLTDQPANFNQKLTSSIVNDPSDYYLAVARFSIDGLGLPIMIWKYNYWYVSLSYGGVTRTQVLLPPPDQPNPNPAYGVAIYTYAEFLTTINVAYASALVALKLATGGGASPIAAALPPYLIYDCANGIMSYYAQSSFYDESIPDLTRINIWNNSALYELFGNYNIFFQDQGRTDKLDIRIKSINFYNTNTSGGYTKTSQEGSNNSRFWDQQSIVFKTSRLGVRPEFIQGANQSQNLISNESAGSGIPFDAIMTDFIPTFGSSEQIGWRQQLVYNAPFYRLIDLLGNQSNTVDLAIFWRDQQGVERPFYIVSGTSATVKLAFVKKSLYKNTKLSQIK